MGSVGEAYRQNLGRFKNSGSVFFLFGEYGGGIWRGNMLDLLGCFFFGKIFWNGIVKENTLDFRSHLFCFFSVG